MLLFMDGFDHYVTADLNKKWTTVGTGATIGATGRRASAGLSTTANANGSLIKTVAPTTSWVIGAAVIYSGAITGSPSIFALLDAGSLQCELRLNVDGTLSVTSNSATAVAGGTSTFALAAATYYYIEFKVTIADSIAADSCKVRVNGVDVLTVPATRDLKATANTTANQVRLGSASGANLVPLVYDDFYAADQSGTVNNNFLGDVRIDTLFPNVDGFYSQFTPSVGTSHFALVDETAPNTTDYNDGLNVGDRDSYGFTDLAALTSQTVHGVQVNAAIMKDDAGAKSAATMVRSATVNADGATVALGTAQGYASHIFPVNPNGTVAWTEATVNAMEAGVVVTA